MTRLDAGRTWPRIDAAWQVPALQARWQHRLKIPNSIFSFKVETQAHITRVSLAALEDMQSALSTVHG